MGEGENSRGRLKRYQGEVPKRVAPGEDMTTYHEKTDAGGSTAGVLIEGNNIPG